MSQQGARLLQRYQQLGTYAIIDDQWTLLASQHVHVSLIAV